MQERSLENISLTLVSTLYPGNIGATARAMKNMGLRHLKLVNPPPLDRSCKDMAVTAYDIVETATIYSSLKEAVADEHIIVGTTSLRGRRQQSPLCTPRELAPHLREVALSHRVSLVFGPERRGLTEEDLSLCRYLVKIPAAGKLPTLNVAQAALLICYEIFTSPPTSPAGKPEISTEAAREAMFRQMERTLIEIGFLSQSNPGHIMRSIRRFLGRADLAPRDVQILRGILSQMSWFVREGRKLPDDRIRKP